ncbi:epoxyqueuosine reductase [Sporomusa sp. GT1]|uniref:epoxyqueuosine reductase n=1 Tax=Sporomusa sp. GT1 TaxID=1534747 RepID=UPI001CB87CA2|nr:epoxyqueuosine reductase [Sporomusa sp. GT1]
MMDFKQLITTMIQTYVQEYQKKPGITSVWGEPLVGFADANHPDISNLKDIISPQHVMPHEVIENPTIIIAYFLPFTKELADTNKAPGNVSSPEWARTYEETNRMFGELNNYLIAAIQEMGYEAGVSKAATTFDQERLISNWSQRHIARVAGLGTFGLNNMLISSNGCCGRYSTVITNLPIEPDKPLDDNYCLYKSKGICGACIKHCPSGALTVTGYDRQKCFQVCLKNAEIYKDFGSSYSDETGKNANSAGSEVCGKCLVNVPCAFK